MLLPALSPTPAVLPEPGGVSVNSNSVGVERASPSSSNILEYTRRPKKMGLHRELRARVVYKGLHRARDSRAPPNPLSGSDHVQGPHKAMGHPGQ